VTGRPHILAEMEKRLAGRMISVSICPTKGDIIGYLRVKLGEDETPDTMNASLEAEILEMIPANISEMCVGTMTLRTPFDDDPLIDRSRFLLVALNIEAILQESTIYRRRERLSRMTDGLGLGDAYRMTIERIKMQSGDKSRLGMAALMWVSHAERPLSADELCHALAVELGSTDFNGDNVPSMSTLVSCCQGLITIDKETSTVRLIHFTLQEYLSALSNIFSRPHSAMAEICLTYLNSKQVKAIGAYSPHGASDIPFLGYYSVYWGVHAKKELSHCARSLTLELFLFPEYDCHISVKFLLKQVKIIRYWDFNADIGLSLSFSGLHCASFFGIVELVAALIEMEWCDINKRDILWHTPLAWAAHNGHEEVVKTLLKQEEINPDKPNLMAMTPLLHAASNGHEGVVKILVGQEEVNPYKPDYAGMTPLARAAQKGHPEVVNILLVYQEANLDKPDTWGATLL